VPFAEIFVCIDVVHCVFEIKISGLRAEQWKELSSTKYGNSPLIGLRPSAIRCIPPQIFKVGINKLLHLLNYLCM
jgi:hypothetical protein